MPQRSSSSGLVRNVVGGVLGGVGTMARGVASLVNPFSEEPASPEDFVTAGETPPNTQRRASPVPTEMDEALADYESDTLNEWFEKESRKSEKQNRLAGLCKNI